MNRFLRKVRGVLGVGLTWGVAWGAIGTLLAVLIGQLFPGSIGPGESRIVLGALIGLVGFVCGVAFSAVLSFAERRKTLAELSLGRAAMWGLIGSSALPLLTTMNNALLLITVPLGVVFATGTVAIARRAERQLAGRSEESQIRSRPLTRNRDESDIGVGDRAVMRIHEACNTDARHEVDVLVVGERSHYQAHLPHAP